MKKCTYCAEEIQDDAKICGHCGKAQGIWGWMALALGVLVIGAVVLALALEIGDRLSEPEPEPVRLRLQTMADWHAATGRERSAAAAEMTDGVPPMTRARRADDALQLRNCLDQVDDEASAQLGVGRTASFCAAFLGWFEATDMWVEMLRDLQETCPDGTARTVVMDPTALCAALTNWNEWKGATELSSPGRGFGNGTHLVGIDIQPGTYRAAAGLDGCYWERLAGLGGDFDDIIANDVVDEGSAIVAISPTDRAFSSDGCGRWTRIEE